jgi:hypothetical protein
MVLSIYQIRGIGPTLNGRNGEGDPYYIDGEIWMAKLVAQGEKARSPAKILPAPALIQIKDKMFSWASFEAEIYRAPAVELNCGRGYDLGRRYISAGQSAGPLTQLQTGQKTDVAWCAADALLRDAFRARKLGPLARQLLPRLHFIVHAAFDRLINRKPGCRGNIEFAASGDVERWHPIGDCDD